MNWEERYDVKPVCVANGIPVYEGRCYIFNNGDNALWYDSTKVEDGWIVLVNKFHKGRNGVYFNNEIRPEHFYMWNVYEKYLVREATQEETKKLLEELR